MSALFSSRFFLVVITAFQKTAAICHRARNIFVCLSGVRMVFFARHQLQILKAVIIAIQILVVYLKAFWYRAIESLPHRSMNQFVRVFGVFAQNGMLVKVGPDGRFERPESRVSGPCFAFRDVGNSNGADTNRASNRCVAMALRKQIFDERNLVGVERLPALDAPNVSLIADFIETLKTKNIGPRLFHISTI